MVEPFAKIAIEQPTLIYGKLKMDNYSQLGISGLTLGILFFIVRWFITTISRKDEQISHITDEFTKVVVNHIAHGIVQSKKETAVLSKLEKTINRLYERTDKK